MKLLLPSHIFNVHHTTMYQFTVSPYSKPHVLGACVLSTCTFGRMTEIFHVLPQSTEVEWILKYELAQKVGHGEEASPTTTSGTQTCSLLITSLVLYHRVITTLSKITVDTN